MKYFRRKLTYSNGFFEVVSFLGFIFFKLYLRCLHIKVTYDPLFSEIGYKKVLFAFWHGRLFLLAPVFGYMRPVTMVDISWAGEIIRRIIKHFGYVVVRGSSKRKGLEGFLKMKKAMLQGHIGALAVDGPRGPIHQSKPGAIVLAKRMNVFIAPVSFSADRAWALHTWDQFIIPKPFAKCHVRIGKPIDPNCFPLKDSGKMLNEYLLNFTSQLDDQLKRRLKKF